jgi:antitoxin component YwqK of YwqJK toxin-antitoxin module
MINYKFKCLRQDLQAFYWEFDQTQYEDHEIFFLGAEEITLPRSLKILLTGISVNGNLEGYTKLVYSETNTTYFTGNFYHNQVHQKAAQTFHPNTQTEYQGDIIFGQKQGYGRIFYSNGSLKIDGEFRNDLFHGTNIKIYHENKNLKYQGDFCLGKKENYGKWYNKNGILVCEGGISGDKVNGDGVKYYYGCGKVKFVGSVVKGRKDGLGV